jgi:thymidylate kinase
MPNVFLIGIPGCGKSFVYKLLKEQLRAEGYKGEILRIDDFPVLKRIFEEDVQHKRHRPTPGGGLKITDDSVWDDLSKALNEQALSLQSPEKLLFIEFSRNNYLRAFKHFSPDILKNSLIVYIDCPFELAWRRNLRRVQKEEGLDAHLVSKEEMELTYSRDDHEELPKHLKVPVVTIKNDSDDLAKLQVELKKVIDKLKLILS